MRYVLRLMANSLAFYLALYLVDSLVAPRFFVGAVWVAVLLAIVLGALNSLVRPLHRMRSKPSRAWAGAIATLVVNALVIQVFMWVGAPLSATGIQWVVITAVFIAVLGGAINWLIGFKPSKEPNVITKELRASREARQRGAKQQGVKERGAKERAAKAPQARN